MKKKTIRLLFLLFLFSAGMGNWATIQAQGGANTIVMESARTDTVFETCLPTTFEGNEVNIPVEITLSSDQTEGLGADYTGWLYLGVNITARHSSIPGALGVTEILGDAWAFSKDSVWVENGMVTTGNPVTINGALSIEEYNNVDPGDWYISVIVNASISSEGGGLVVEPPSESEAGVLRVSFQPEDYAVTGSDWIGGDFNPQREATFICSGSEQSGLLEITDPQDGVTYTWTHNGNTAGEGDSYAIPADSLVNYTNELRTDTITVTAHFGSPVDCEGATKTFYYTVNPIPAVSEDTPGEYPPICEGSPLDITVYTENTTKVVVTTSSNPGMDPVELTVEGDSVVINVPGDITLAGNDTVYVTPWYVHEGDTVECSGEQYQIAVAVISTEATENLAFGYTVNGGDSIQIQAGDNIALCPDSEIDFLGKLNMLTSDELGYRLVIDLSEAGSSAIDMSNHVTSLAWQLLAQGGALVNNTNRPITVAGFAIPYVAAGDFTVCEGDTLHFSVTVLPDAFMNVMAEEVTCPDDQDSLVVDDYIITIETASIDTLVILAPGTDANALNFDFSSGDIRYPVEVGGPVDLGNGITASTVSQGDTLWVTTITVPGENKKSSWLNLITDSTYSNYTIVGIGQCGIVEDAFSVTVLPGGDLLKSDHAGKVLRYRNGDMVQDINLNPYIDLNDILELLPISTPPIQGGPAITFSNITFHWMRMPYSDIVSGPTDTRDEGVDVIPRFYAVNDTDEKLRAVFKYYITITYTHDGEEYECTVYSKDGDELIIEVEPYADVDTRISVQEIADIKLCGGTLEEDIVFRALYDMEVNPDTIKERPFDQIRFAWKLVSGDDVLNLSATQGDVYSAAGTDSVVFVDVSQALNVGSGLYSVTPYWLNSEGRTMYFNVSVSEGPVITYLRTERVGDGTSAATAPVFNVGDLISILTQGAPIYEWTIGGDSIGLTSGAGIFIPPFRATASGIAEITVTPISENGCRGEAQTIFIKVNDEVVMQPVGDLEREVCSGVDNISIPLAPGDPFVYRLTLVSGVDLGLTLDGAGIVGSYENPFTYPVTGVYEIVLVDESTGVESEPQVFSVTVLPVASINALADIVASHGTVVPSFAFTGNSGDGVYTWQLSGGTPIANLAVSGAGKAFPSFTAVNTGTEVIAATYQVMAAFGDCEPAIEEFTITVYPEATIPVAIEDTALCTGSEYHVEFTGAASTVYELKLEAGQDIGISLDRAGDVWTIHSDAPLTNTTQVPITAVYSLTAINDSTGVKGEVQRFSIKVLPAPAVDKPDDIVAVNGMYVPAFSFTGNVSGGTYSWELTGGTGSLNLATQGEGMVFHGFVATNLSPDPVTATYTVRGHSGGCDPAEQTFTITIYPAPEILQEIADTVICSGGDFALTIAAQDNVYYTNRLIGGTNLGLTAVDVNGALVIEGTAIENNTSAPIIGIYEVIPFNSTVGLAGKSQVYTIRVLPETNVHQVVDQTICNNSATTPVHFGGDVPATIYEWTAVIDGDLTGFPASGYGDIPSHVLVNRGTTPATVTVTVTPRYEANAVSGQCPGAEMSFVITVNPTPVVDQVADIIYSYDQGQSDPIVFNSAVAGVTYKWKNDNTDTGLASEGEGDIDPFAVKNNSTVPIVSRVTVTPWYDGCEGAAMTFTITVNPKPDMGVIANQEYCEGSLTHALDAQLGHGAGSYITWTVSGDYVGLKNSDQYGGGQYKSIPSYTAEYNLPRSNDAALAKATVTVTPYYDNAGVISAGDPFIFEISVIPNTLLDPGYEQADARMEVCPSNQEIVLEVKATGYMLKYQWYKDGVEIPGANGATYTIAKEEATNYHAGEYYAVVASGYKNTCDNTPLRSVTYNVKLNVVSQRWNDVMVLNCNPETNGGFIFTDYQWYTMPAGGGAESKLSGENLSYLQVPGGVSDQVAYIVKAVTSTGSLYTSCPVIGIVGGEAVLVSIYPNPASVGQQVTVESLGVTLSKIQLVSDVGRVLGSQNATGAKTLVTMPNTPGIYIIRVVLSGTDETRDFKVIVK